MQSSEQIEPGGRLSLAQHGAKRSAGYAQRNGKSPVAAAQTAGPSARTEVLGRDDNLLVLLIASC